MLPTNLPLQTLVLLSLILCFSAQQPRRDVPKYGPEGTLEPLERLRDTVGTATQVWAHGMAQRLSVLHTLRSGPISPVYRAAISSGFAAQPCQTREDEKCEVGIGGFSQIGEVHYKFENTARNIRGRSSQVMVACRCLEVECGVAILVRPVNIWTLGDDGKKKSTGKRVCLYEAVDNHFSDCFGELLRVSYRDKNVVPEYTHGGGEFNYSVEDILRGQWNAVGQRGWGRDCMDTVVNQLPTVNLSTITEKNIRFNKKQRARVDDQCVPSGDVQYYRAESDNDCVEIYDYAAEAATYVGSQQDEIAVGHMEESYQSGGPPLVPDTELALICSAAGIGVFFVWTMYRKLLKKHDVTIIDLVIVVVLQVIVLYVLEALPMHISLASEIRARDWHSLFAFADGSIALAEAVTGPRGTAKGSVLILTVVLGEVRYLKTREGLVGGLTAMFDLIAIVLIGMTVIRKLRFILGGSRAQIYGIDGAKQTTAPRLSETAQLVEKWMREGRGKHFRRRRSRFFKAMKSSSSNSRFSGQSTSSASSLNGSPAPGVASKNDPFSTDIGAMSSAEFESMLIRIRQEDGTTKGSHSPTHAPNARGRDVALLVDDNGDIDGECRRRKRV